MSLRALVTNDDGVDSVGIRTLARVARDAGLEVVVAAPGRDSSGTGTSLTAGEDHRRFRVHHRTWDEAGIEAVLAVEAAPAFIVRAAITGAFGTTPDVVLSGINHGLNTGRSVLHSGTVGAALTAATLGRPALALSMGTAPVTYWETASEVASAALRWLLDAGDAVMLNVNVPNVARGALGGFERARLAAVGEVQATFTDSGQGYLKVDYHDRPAALEPGTDEAFLASGVACFTPLWAVSEADEVVTDGLEIRRRSPGDGMAGGATAGR